MGKVFLSHSSLDKNFVEPIAQLLGKNNCVYDKFTFEEGAKTSEEIFKNLEESDIFVYFISNAALESKWVKFELNQANRFLSDNRIKQIYPIIIDSNINHEDERIASFLKKNYNVQHVDNYKIATRKILHQLAKLEFFNYSDLYQSKNYFYGRDAEIKEFKDRFDDVFSNNSVKSIVVSGIPGIGKKSYLQKVLQETKVIAKYYSPVTISLKKYSTIDDVILELVDVGYGSFSLKDLSYLSIDEKIDILIEMMNSIQKYKEVIIIEDDECIINSFGNMVFWFKRALNESDNGISLLISSNVHVDNNERNKYPDCFFINLNDLTRIETMGVLRTYSSKLGIEISREDSQNLLGFLTGYPPQIIYCVDLINENGIFFAKENSYMVTDMPRHVSAQILEKVGERFNSEEFMGFLTAISKIDMVPMGLIGKMYKVNNNYKDIFFSLKRYSICYLVGASREYVTINSVIQDYVTRNMFDIPEDIQKLLDSELKEFNKKLEEDLDDNLENISEVRYFLKENLKRGIEFSSSFLYSTIIVQTIIDLYKNQKYNDLKNIINKIKNDERYNAFDDSVKKTIQLYYCLTLIKNHSTEFSSEVEYFADNNWMIDYHYLKGFNYRNRCLYKKAKIEFKKVLSINKKHYSAKAQLVRVYISLQEFNAAIVLAKENYYHNRDNLFYIQSFFECLMEQRKLSREQERDLNEMCQILKRSHRINPTPFYYELLSQYELLINHNISEALRYINDGLVRFPKNMYILRIKFDIYKKDNDISKMEETLEELRESVNDFEYKGIYISRKAILALMQGQSVESVKLLLKNEGDFPNDYINRIVKKYAK